MTSGADVDGDTVDRGANSYGSLGVIAALLFGMAAGSAYDMLKEASEDSSFVYNAAAALACLATASSAYGTAVYTMKFYYATRLSYMGKDKEAVAFMNLGSHKMINWLAQLSIFTAIFDLGSAYVLLGYDRLALKWAVICTAIFVVYAVVPGMWAFWKMDQAYKAYRVEGDEAGSDGSGTAASQEQSGQEP